MSEWISTGQMVDTLKVGEEAECSIGNDIVVVKSESGQILVKTAYDITYPLTLDFKTDEAQWRILPKYLSFEDALKGHANGKAINLHLDLDNAVLRFPFQDKLVETLEFYKEYGEELSLMDLYEGKWTIEGDVNV